jgi:hypothetical protein
MKNRHTLMGILAVVLVFGLAFVGCKQPTDDNDGGTVNADPKKVMITGITGIAGRYCRIMVTRNKLTQLNGDNVPDNVAVGSTTIGGDTVEIPLKVPNQNFYETDTLWTGNGKYYVLFGQADGSGGVMTYTGNTAGPIQVDFNEAEKSLSFDKFTLFSDL